MATFARLTRCRRLPADRPRDRSSAFRTVLIDGARLRGPRRLGPLPRLGRARRVAARRAARAHHSTVSPYFLSRACSSPAGSDGFGERAAARSRRSPRRERRHSSASASRQLALGEVVGRVEEHQVVRTAWPPQERRHGAAVHPDRGIPPTDFATFAALRSTTAAARARLLDEIDGCRAAADRLQPERARSGVEVEDGGAAQRVGRLQRAEQRLAHAVAGGPGAGIGDLERDRAGAPRDDPSSHDHDTTARGARRVRAACLDSEHVRLRPGIAPRRRRRGQDRRPRSSRRSACGRSATCSRTTPAAMRDRGELTPISSLPIGEPVTIVAEVRRASERRMQNRKGSLLEVVISDGQGELSLTFFNQSWRAEGSAARASRRLRRQGGGVPRCEAARPPRLRAVRRRGDRAADRRGEREPPDPDLPGHEHDRRAGS